MRRLLFALPVLTSLPALAASPIPPSPATFCESAVSAAEAGANLPPRLMQAIALTETGRLDPSTGTARPWPWTINAEGTGQYFKSKPEAIAAVKALRARGVQSIDVGCMQVNLMHHPAAFASLDDALDPHLNARYAARFLNALYARHRDWMLAIGAYHSETPTLADAYRNAVLTRWQRPTLASQPYRAFAQQDQFYTAFSRSGRVYGAFTTGDGATTR